MMDRAEKLKQVATDYKCTSKFDKANLVPALSGEILFDMSQEEKAQRLDTLFKEVNSQMQDITAKAKKCLDGSKQVKKAEEANKLKGMAT